MFMRANETRNYETTTNKNNTIYRIEKIRGAFKSNQDSGLLILQV
jgi:hypothetical protein